MLNENHSMDLLNTLTHHSNLEHQSKMSKLIESHEFNLFQMLKPRLFIDGNMWCVLYGKDIQEGICGFGKSPLDAIYAWNKEWDKKI